MIKFTCGLVIGFLVGFTLVAVATVNLEAESLSERIVNNDEIKEMISVCGGLDSLEGLITNYTHYTRFACTGDEKFRVLAHE